MIQEMRDGRALVTIAREGIASLTLRRGMAAERPIIEGPVGLVMVCGGLWLTLGALGALMHGPVSRGIATLLTAGAFLSVMGVVLLVRVLRVCDLVEIALHDGGRRKLALSAAQTPERRRDFAARLRALGWSVSAASGD
jgi:hypothetical protein